MMKRLFTLLFAASCLTAVGQVPEYVPNEGLVAWYPFNGDAADFSGNGHHGTMEGVLSATDRHGVNHQSLAFDGVDDGVFIPHHENFLSVDQTITCWINVGPSVLEDTPGFLNSMGLINKTNQALSNAQNSFLILQLLGFEEPSFEPYNVKVAGSTGSVVNGSSVESATTDSVIYSDNWYFIAATITDTSFNIFINGELQATNALLHPRLTNTSDIKIGVDPKFNSYRFFNGRMDDIGFWNRALEAQEILDLYLAPPPVMGCMDPEACNFEELAVVDDGTCASCATLATACGEGTAWDPETQTCIVANPADTNLDGCVQLNDLLDLLSAYGDCGAEESAWQCGDPLEYQGYDYATVQIGEQCWFAENLRAENYRNGDAVTSELSDLDWSGATYGAVAVFGEGESNCSHYSPEGDACLPTWSISQFGRLYNWYAVNDERALCKTGWHVPSDEDWIALEMTLGMSEVIANSSYYRGTQEGRFLKDSMGWSECNNGECNNGNNSSGFTGKPAGYRLPNGDFDYAGYDLGMWSSTPADDNKAMRRNLTAYPDFKDLINRGPAPRNYGLSVRCVKDVQ